MRPPAGRCRSPARNSALSPFFHPLRRVLAFPAVAMPAIAIEPSFPPSLASREQVPAYEPMTLRHGDRTRLVALGARQVKRQDAVAAFRLDLVGVDIDWQRYGAVEAPGRPFAAMHRGFFSVIDALGAGDAQRVALDLDVEIRLAHAGHLDNRNDIVALAEDVDRRIGAAGPQPRPEPAAGPERVNGALKFPELFERIEQRRHYLILLSEMSCTPSRRREERIRFKF